MPKAMQSRKDLYWERVKAAHNADFKNLGELRRKIAEVTKEEINRTTFEKVFRGLVLSGPKATLIMKTTSTLVGKKVETLWPELKDVA